jgi:general secretion pathway protein J
MTARRFRGRANVRDRHDGGFTLIEVLVSLVLLALVLTLLAGGVRYARSTWDAAARLDQLAGAEMAEAFLRARLGEAMAVYEPRTAGTMRVLFRGAGDSVSFVAPAPNGPTGAGLYRYTLEAAPGAGRARGALVVKLAPHQAPIGEAAPEVTLEQHNLMHNITSVAFRYFGRSEIKAEPVWHSAWTRADAMPSLVEITVARDDSEGGPLTLVVELRLQSATR